MVLGFLIANTKNNGIFGVVFNVKDQKEVFKDQVETLDVGDVKREPEKLKLLDKSSFNWFNITTLGFTFQVFLKLI